MISGWGPTSTRPRWATRSPRSSPWRSGRTPTAAGTTPSAEHLAAIPEVLEACTITGAGDMWCRVVARSNTDLQRVIDAVLVIAGIVRSSTVIALATQVPYRVRPGLGV